MAEVAVSPSHHSMRGTTTSSSRSNRSYSITSSSTHHSASDAASDSPATDDYEMTEREKETFTSVAKSMTESLLEATDLLGGIPWCLVHEKHGISLFRADVGNNVPCNVHAVCKVTCEIEDVAESMITSTTESYTHMMELLSSDFLDGAVIQNIVEPTALKPHRYVGLKWAAFKSSSKFTKDRDFTILEYVDMIEDEQGQKIAVRVMESVDVPQSSKYAESAKYTRDVVPLMGFMYHTTKKPGELRMTYTCNFDNGDLPAWAANSAIQSHVEKCINGILKYIETFRAKKETIVLPQQVMSMCEQDHCKVCERNFCVLRRRYNCLKCGEVICSSCSRIRNAVVPEHGERQLRVCTACVLEVRRTSRLATDSPHACAIDSGAASPARSSSQQSPVVRTQSFSGAAGKRRSCDDLLEPVRNRLMEHKTFSASPDAAAEIPKATFPLRSLSDGFVMRKGNFFTSRRRGSPADLAISIEAFRNHQMRMAGASSEQEHEPADDDDDDGDDESLTDTEDSLRQFEYFSSARNGAASSDSGESSPTGSSPSQSQARTPSSTSSSQRGDRRYETESRLPTTLLESGLSPLNATQPLIEEGVRSRKPSAFESKLISSGGGNPFVSTVSETRAKLDAAIQRSQLIIEDAAYANNLAQHARKLSHHRIVALQREYEVMGPISSSGASGSSHNNQLESRSSHRTEELDQQVVVLSRAQAERVHPTPQLIGSNQSDRGVSKRHHHSKSREVRAAYPSGASEPASVSEASNSKYHSGKGGQERGREDV